MSWVVSKLLEWNVTGRYRITHASASQRVYTQFIPLRLKNSFFYNIAQCMRSGHRNCSVSGREMPLKKDWRILDVIYVQRDLFPVWPQDFYWYRTQRPNTMLPFHSGSLHPRRPRGSQSGREKAGRKFSSTGETAPGHRLSPNYFEKFERMPAPDWAQKMLCIIVPNRRTFSPEFFFREFVHHGYCLATLARFVHQTCASKGNFYLLLS